MFQVSTDGESDWTKWQPTVTILTGLQTAILKPPVWHFVQHHLGLVT